MDSNSAIAFARFGLGRRHDEPVPADPRAWLRLQLAGPDTASAAGLPGTPDILAQIHALREARKRLRADMAQTTPVPGAADDQSDPLRTYLGDLQKQERVAYLNQALTTPAGFRERLVWFWYNHFTVATRSEITNGCVGAYIREAIRPHVTGRFVDMLMEVMHHPAMLDYLDQSSSVGPDSAAGQKTHHGLNENLARECLELHTVSPASGYTQADVTSFARVLTGWSIDLGHDPAGFVFHPKAHEPGRQTVMGEVWPEGEEGAMALLAWLGTHPATYHHLATKLVRHFVADDPPPGDVAHIERVLAASGGNLGAASNALIDLPGAWHPLTKLRTPQEYVVAVLRAAGTDAAFEPHMPGIVDSLGQPLFRAPFPIGWPDRAADWASPEALLQRVDFSYQLAGRLKDQDGMALADASLGPLLSADTLDAMRGAASRRDALCLLFASPEFLRR